MTNNDDILITNPVPIGITRKQIKALIREYTGVPDGKNDSNDSTSYVIYAIRTYNLINNMWTPSDLLKIGKAGSLSQRARQYEQSGQSIRCEWAIWVDKENAKLMEKLMHEFFSGCKYHDPNNTIATEVFNIDAKTSLSCIHALKDYICDHWATLSLHIYDHDYMYSYDMKPGAFPLYSDTKKGIRKEPERDPSHPINAFFTFD